MIELKEEKIKLKYIEIVYGSKYDSIEDVTDNQRDLVETMPLFHMLKFVLKSLYHNGGKHNSYTKLALDFGCTKRVVQRAVMREKDKELSTC